MLLELMSNQIVEAEGFPDFWYKFFDRDDLRSSEATMKNFISQAVYTALRGKRPPALRALLRESPKDVINALAVTRYRSKFPEKRIEKELERLESEKIMARRAKNSEGRRIQKSEYRVALSRIKSVQEKSREFKRIHNTIKGRLRAPGYHDRVLNILRGRENPDSNVARLAVLFVMGHWMFRLQELLLENVGMTLTEAVDKYFKEHVASTIKDPYERIIVREAIRCFDGLLIPFGEYLNEFYEDCMFCDYKSFSRGSTETDNALHFLFPGTQMYSWLRFSPTRTIPAMLKEKLPVVFEYDLNPEPEKPSARRIIGLSARKKVSYQPFAALMVQILRLMSKQNKAAYYHGLYLDLVMEKAYPYIKHIEILP
jgi:hypothetical protein